MPREQRIGCEVVLDCAALAVLKINQPPQTHGAGPNHSGSLMIFPGSFFGWRGLFILLGVADLLITCYLLGAAPGQFYESNPVARWWLDRWGWAGLASFKAATVLLALAAVGVVARRRR